MKRSKSLQRTLEDNDELISQVIAKVVAAIKIKDIKINEISTEEIIRNIYEKGVSVRRGADG